MRAGLIALLVVVVGAVVVALNSFFIVNPTQQALVLQFGEVKQAIREPGLNAKIPIVQDVLFLDRRVLDLNIPAQEIIAADQKRLVVDAFMRYRVADPVRFYQTVNNVREGATRLSTFAQSSLRAVLADATFQAIVRDERDELMKRIKDDVAVRARDIGVEVVDVKIRRADLPEANSEAIFERMKTERVQEATQIRAQGQEAAQRLRASADRTATVLRAEAQREADQIRGQGDGQANAIFARAYSEDPNFFAFFRAMQAYEHSFRTDDTRLILSPDADFFRYFNDPLGQGRTATSQPDPAELLGPATSGGGVTPGEPVDPGDGPAPDESAAIPALPEADSAATTAAGIDAAAAVGDSPTEAELAAEAEAATPAAEASTEAAIESAEPETSAAADAAANADVTDSAPTDERQASPADQAASDGAAGAPSDTAVATTSSEDEAEEPAVTPSEPGTVTIVRPGADGAESGASEQTQ